MTSCTPGSPSSRDASTRPSLPARPTAVRWAPGRGLASYPMSRITATTRAISCSVAPGRITMSTSLSSYGEPVAVLGDRDRAREARARALRGVRSLHLRIEVRQDEAGRAGLPGERAGTLGRQVDVDCLGLGERALGEQQIALRGPLGELVARPRVPRVDEPSLGRCDAHRYALGRVRHVTGLEADVGAERERLPVADVQDADRESGIEEPGAEPLRERLDEADRADGAEDHEGLLARWRRRMAQGEDEHGQLAEVIGVKMGHHLVGDLLPGQTELGQPMQDPGAAVEQDVQRAALHQVAGIVWLRRRSDGPGADCHELHALAPYAGSSWPRRTPTIVETPGSCIVTP